MILDKQNMFSEAQAVVASAASENVIDLGAGYKEGRPLEIFAMVETTFASDTADATLSVALQVDDDEAFGTAETLWMSAGIDKDNLAQGYELRIPGMVAAAGKRYARLYYTCSAAMTAGKITSGLVFEKQTNRRF